MSKYVHEMDLSSFWDKKQEMGWLGFFKELLKVLHSFDAKENFSEQKARQLQLITDDLEDLSGMKSARNPQLCEEFNWVWERISNWGETPLVPGAKKWCNFKIK